jgi:hypothetical protein
MSKKQSKITISDLLKIQEQYNAGAISILELSKLWNIPYATLYRALKPKKK